MAYTWRTELNKAIKDDYIRTEQEWFDIVVSASGHLNATIVSDQFANIPLPQRREQFEHFLRQFEPPVSTGFLSLYTVEDAKTLELAKPVVDTYKTAYNWFDVAQQAANPSESPQIPQREPRIPRTIAFYSFKGGVGRTTALVHAATILAMQGRKIVTVDLDMEAPGLSLAFNLTPLPEHGIVDYFYERAYLPRDAEPSISIADIFGEIRIPNASGRIFVVPAGTLTINYLAEIDDLRSAAITERGEDLWSTFYREITEQLQPDIILVDSRTGFNEWGAFSLLRAADKAIIFLYPNEQNSAGGRLLTQVLEQKIPTYFVFSLVPAVKDAGMAMVQEQWGSMQKDYKANSQTKEVQRKLEDLIVIPYLTAIALAKTYPVQELLPYYQPIAKIIDEDMNEIRLQGLLRGQKQRPEILNSLIFPNLNIEAEGSVRQDFQRTANFDKLLDENGCLILGHKGTGKSVLYNLLLKHRDDATAFAYGRLRTVTCISGFEMLRAYLTMDMLQNIDQEIEHSGRTWADFWGFLLLLHLYHNNHLPTSIIRDSLHGASPPLENHEAENSDAFAAIMAYVRSNIDVRDVLTTLNKHLQQEQQTLWLLYDDIDRYIVGEVREKALAGLFQLVQNTVRSLKYIKFKVFLAEDVWSNLSSFDKKDFNGRSFNLSWTYTDFLRLALRQAQCSELFKTMTNSFSPIENIDQVSEEVLTDALQLLWGSRREADTQSERVSLWLYRSLSDASGTTFPGLINTLLRKAVQVELQADKDQPLPADRLLSSKSLQEGLIAAIQERCEDMRQTYPQLQPFFDALAGQNHFMHSGELQSIWLNTAKKNVPELKDFAHFVSYLRGIGLIMILEQESVLVYLFANMYATGFNMKRSAVRPRFIAL
ncbi:MAG: ParA family protein [Ktedonobacteraceae bacterium]